MRERPDIGDVAVIADTRVAAQERIPELERALKERGVTHALHVAAGGMEVEEEARRAFRSSSRVVAFGDDGTVLDVVNGAFEVGRPVVAGDDPPVVAIVPASTSCDFARNFGLPGDIERACDHIAAGSEYDIDLMKVTATAKSGETIVRFAAGVCQIGLGGLAARPGTSVPSPLGRGRKFAAYWSAVARSKPRRVDVLADTKAYTGPALDVVVGNTQYAMGGLRVSPRSFPSDGVLDVLVWRGPRSDAIGLLPSMLRLGDFLPHPRVAEMRAKIRVAVDCERPLAVAIDGRRLGETPVSVQIVPRAIRLRL